MKFKKRKEKKEPNHTHIIPSNVKASTRRACGDKNVSGQ